MANHEDDVDLLLSLQDKVLETPPGSPSALRPQSTGYPSDDESAKRTEPVDMSMFRDVVEDCLDYGAENAKQALKAKQMKKSNDPDVEQFSGLRIRNQLVSSLELNNRFSDIRFVRLSAIKNVLNGDTLHGCWATVGVVAEKGITKVSSTGKNFCIWKIGSLLDEKTISVFLFGDAYQKFSKETPGAVFAFFNCGVRKDNMGAGFSLSVYSAPQILKIGTSADYGVCKGKRKDGMACTLVINKRRGVYCSYHRSTASEKYTNKRSELKGGNLNTAFRGPYKPEGVYSVDPMAGRSKTSNSKRPIQFLCVDDMKKALSNAGKVTTNVFSQGIRFLTEVTGKMVPQPADKGRNLSKLQTSGKRPLSSTKLDAASVRNHQPNGKKAKVENEQNPKKNEVKEKMIELDFVSSDEEL